MVLERMSGDEILLKSSIKAIEWTCDLFITIKTTAKTAPKESLHLHVKLL